MAHATYSSREVVASWGGIPLTDFAEDNFFTISENSPFTTNKVGANGTLATSISPDSTGTVEVGLMDVGNTSKILSGIYGAQKAGIIPALDLIRLPLVIADPAGTTLALFQGAHIMSIGDVVMGIENNTRTFTFHIENLLFTAAPSGFASGVAGLIGQVNGFIGANT